MSHAAFVAETAQLYDSDLKPDLNMPYVPRLLQDYKFLTFARIPPPPPPPWVGAHGLLHQALQHYVQAQTQVLPLTQQRVLKAALADLSLEWYIDLLSRLHINSFRYS